MCSTNDSSIALDRRSAAPLRETTKCTPWDSYTSLKDRAKPFEMPTNATTAVTAVDNPMTVNTVRIGRRMTFLKTKVAKRMGQIDSCGRRVGADDATHAAKRSNCGNERGSETNANCLPDITLEPDLR